MKQNWFATTALLLCAQGLAGVSIAGAQTPDAPAADENEIVITAERHKTTLQRSSLSIEVFAQEELEAVSSPQDLTALSPGVQVGTSGPSPQVYIRGVGEYTANSRTQGGVAFNVDGVYYGRTTQVGPSMFDLARVELLKGPQGTLYGRNASGGAINIVTRLPKLGEFSGDIGGEFGAFDALNFRGALNVPLGDKAALRIAGESVDREGFTSNGGQDQVTQAARVRLLWEPSSAVSLLLNADAQHIGGEGSGTVVKDDPDPWRDVTDEPTAWPFLFGGTAAPFFSRPDDRFMDSDAWGASAELNANLGFATLTVIPAYRSQDQVYVSYTSNFRFWEDIADEQTSLEVRLGNSTELLNWTLGAYYYDQQQELFLSPFSSGNLAGVAFDQSDVAWALFGQATFNVTSDFRLIAGARYTEEEVTGQYQQGSAGPPIVAFVPTTPVVDAGSLKFDATNFKVGAEYDLTEDNMLFLTYSTGFKAGGFYQTLSCGAGVYDPEDVRAWTLGARNRFADGALQINAELFHWEYIDQQIAFVGTDACGGTTFITENPGNATMQGLSVDVVARPTDNDTVRFTLEYNDATYDSFRLTVPFLGAYAPVGGTKCATTGTTVVDCSGQRLARTPEFAGTVSFEHAFDLGGGGEITAGVDAQWATERWLDTSYLPNGEAEGYIVPNAKIRYEPLAGDWAITAFVRNIGDEVVYTGGASIATLAPNGYRHYAATIQAPETWGVRLDYNF